MMGKTDLVNGAVRLRERQPAGGTPPAGTNSATGGASLHHARRQRRKRKPYRPERAGVFLPRRGQNLLALSWHANGLYYGVGVEIDLWLHAGFDVLVNGSRAHLPQARARYQSALLPICLQVSPEILRQRLETAAAKRQ